MIREHTLSHAGADKANHKERFSSIERHCSSRWTQRNTDKPSWLAVATLCSFSKCLLLRSMLLVPYWSVFIVVTVPSWCQPVVSIKLNPRFLHHWYSTPNCTGHVVQFSCNSNNSSVIHVVQIIVKNNSGHDSYPNCHYFTSTHGT